ncbi:MAG: molybdopterin-dependent oxidoreductase [Meiothermus silvanus]|nr:molybdopterin-dependent oxidoreductase [Allomeiothermus silvanus]
MKRLLSVVVLVFSALAAAQRSEVELAGLLERPAKLSLADLQRLAAETVTVSFLSGQGPEQHTYKGVRLAALLQQAGLKLENRKNDKLRKFVLATAKDGYTVIFSWAELDPEFGAQPVLLAWEEDGKPLEGSEDPSVWWFPAISGAGVM